MVTATSDVMGFKPPANPKLQNAAPGENLRLRVEEAQVLHGLLSEEFGETAMQRAVNLVCSTLHPGANRTEKCPQHQP